MSSDEIKWEFLRHCQSNNLEGVNHCLSHGVDVNTKAVVFGDISSALMLACQNGNPAIVARLVQVPGLDINFQNEAGDSAAYCASFLAEIECVRILAETGKVDWNQGGSNGDTPLYLALYFGASDTADIIMRQPHIDYNVKTQDGGATLGQAAVRGGDAWCVETLAEQERFVGWNVPDRNGLTPIMVAFKDGKREMVEILLRCPRVDLSCTDQEGWSLVFRAIQRNKLGKIMLKCSVQKTLLYVFVDFVKTILSKLEKPYSGCSLACIAVEVGEEEDIRLLVQAEREDVDGCYDKNLCIRVDWNKTAEDEDPAILWALKNEKSGIVDILMAVNKINLQGDLRADLTREIVHPPEPLVYDHC